MHEPTRQRIIAKLLSLPPVEWPKALVNIKKRNRFSTSDMDDLARTMDDAAERLAFLSSYISVRFGCTGCGEHPVDSAVKHAQKRQTKVVEALGYYKQYRRPFFSSCKAEE